MSKISPTARTLKLLRDQGYLAAVVERRVPHTFTTIDLFGFCDVVAVGWPHKGTLYVQVTSGANHAARRKKLAALPDVARVRAAGNRVQIISWALRRPRGTPRARWTPRIEEL